MRLIATKKRRYGTRMMQAGESFEQNDTIGRVLVAIGLAKEDDSIQPTTAVVKPANPGLESARAEYKRATGKKPFHGWGIETLKTKIAEAKAA